MIFHDFPINTSIQFGEFPLPLLIARGLSSGYPGPDCEAQRASQTREVLGWEMVERWRQLAAVHSGPSVLAPDLVVFFVRKPQAVAFRKTTPAILVTPGQGILYDAYVSDQNISKDDKGTG